MKITRLRHVVLAVAVLALLPSAGAASSEAAPESRRMSRAKDLIADEQWTRAIEELRAAADDPREPNRDEALFWLAHSQNQDSDFASAVESIRRLAREFPSSRWVKPARSLLIELAQKLRRDDVLWWTAVPTPPPPPVAVTPPPAGAGPRRGATPRPAPTAPIPSTPQVPPAPVPPPAPAAWPVPSTPPVAWVAETWAPDADQRILALGTLIQTDAAKVIPMLRKLAFEESNPGAARRAVFVLAQSRKPEALLAVVEVAQHGPEFVRVAAVRGLGNFGGPDASQALLEVYSTADEPVKRQVVSSLGERAEAPALMRIATSEADRQLRATAIVTLGRAGGRQQLFALYAHADRDTKRPIIAGLFTCRGDDELIRIADQEQDEQLRTDVLSRLRLLGTPKARAYLAKDKQ
jgi:HEAT repeat protein